MHPVTTQPTITLAPLPALALLSAYELHLKSIGRRPRGIYGYLEVLKLFCRWLPEGATPEMITLKTIERYREHRAQAGRSMKTIFHDLTVIRSFVRWCVRQELLATDITRDLVFPKVRRPLPRAMQRAELLAMLEAIDQPTAVPGPEDKSILKAHRRIVAQKPRAASYDTRNRLTMLIILFTGLRISEVAALLWGDIDLVTGMLRVVDGKGGKDRTIPLHARLSHELRLAQPKRFSPNMPVIAQKNGRPLTRKSVSHIFERWLVARGVKTTAHRIRHTFATELLRAGGDLESLRQLLGHASLETTQIYLLVTPEHLRGTIDKLPDFEPAAPRKQRKRAA